MKNVWKRSLSLFLAIVMILGNVPVNALATEMTDPAQCDHANAIVASLTDATCAAEGSASWICEACGTEWTETIAAAGHTYEPADAGSVIVYTCARCGDSYEEAKADAAPATEPAVTEEPAPEQKPFGLQRNGGEQTTSVQIHGTAWIDNSLSEQNLTKLILGGGIRYAVLRALDMDLDGSDTVIYRQQGKADLDMGNSMQMATRQDEMTELGDELYAVVENGGTIPFVVNGEVKNIRVKSYTNTNIQFMDPATGKNADEITLGNKKAPTGDLKAWVETNVLSNIVVDGVPYAELPGSYVKDITFTYSSYRWPNDAGNREYPNAIRITLTEGLSSPKKPTSKPATGGTIILQDMTPVYKVTLESVEGETFKQPIDVIEGYEPDFPYEVPTRDNYTFDSWELVDGYEVDGKAYSDLTYRAVWIPGIDYHTPNSADVTNGNGTPNGIDDREEEFAVKHIIYEGNEVTEYHPYGKDVLETRPDPKREGYAFIIWTRTEGTAGSTVKSNLTYEAKWAKLYTFSYMDDKGNPILNKEGKELTAEQKEGYLPVHPTLTVDQYPDQYREGYRFVGWTSDGETGLDANGKVAGNAVYKGIWEEIEGTDPPVDPPVDPDEPEPSVKTVTVYYHFLEDDKPESDVIEIGQNAPKYEIRTTPQDEVAYLGWYLADSEGNLIINAANETKSKKDVPDYLKAYVLTVKPYTFTEELNKDLHLLLLSGTDKNRNEHIDAAYMYDKATGDVLTDDKEIPMRDVTVTYEYRTAGGNLIIRRSGKNVVFSADFMNEQSYYKDTLLDDEKFVRWECKNPTAGDAADVTEVTYECYAVMGDDYNRNGIYDANENFAIDIDILGTDKDTDYEVFTSEHSVEGVFSVNLDPNTVWFDGNLDSDDVAEGYAYNSKTGIDVTITGTEGYRIVSAEYDYNNSETFKVTPQGNAVTITIPGIQIETDTYPSDFEHVECYVHVELEEIATDKDAAWVIDEKTYNNQTANAIYDTLFTSPVREQDDNVEVTYVARPEMTADDVIIEPLFQWIRDNFPAQFSTQVMNYIDAQLGDFIPVNSNGDHYITVSLGSVELSVEETVSPNVLSVQDVANEHINALISELINTMKSDSVSLDDLEGWVNKVMNLPTDIELDAEERAEILPFGYYGKDEIVNVTYAAKSINKQNVPLEIDDKRSAYNMSAVKNLLEVDYKTSVDGKLKANVADTSVADDNLVLPVSYASQAATTYNNVSVIFPGSATHKAGRATFDLQINKADANVSVPSLVIKEHNEPYTDTNNPDPIVAEGVDTIRIIAGVDMTALDIDVHLSLDNPVLFKNIDPVVWIKLPNTLRNMLDMVNSMDVDLGEMAGGSVNPELLELIEELIANNEAERTLDETLELVEALMPADYESVSRMLHGIEGASDGNMKIVFGDGYPENPGVYLNMAIVADLNYVNGVNTDPETGKDYGLILNGPVLTKYNNGIQLVSDELPAGTTHNVYAFKNNGKPHALRVEGHDDAVIYYYGFNSGLAVHYKDAGTTAPTQAGAYLVSAYVIDEENGKQKMLSDMAILLVGVERTITSVPHNTVQYDGDPHSLVPSTTGEMDNKAVARTIISGQIYDTDRVDLTLMRGEINIDLPVTLDNLWKEAVADLEGKFQRLEPLPNEITKVSLSADEAVAFLEWCKNKIANQEDNTVTIGMNMALNQLITVVNEVEDRTGIAITFANNKGYTEVGSYLYYAVATDYGYISSADYGVLTIVAETFDEDGIVIGSLTYNGTEQFPEVIVPDGITYEVIGDKQTDAGSYELTIKGTGNYSGEVTLPWTITPAPLTVKANDCEIFYGEELKNDGVTYEGFVNGEDESVLTGSLLITHEYEQGMDAGEYDITPSGLASDNYKITYVPGVLTVGGVELTITANSYEITYGGAAPEMDVTYAGFVNGDTAAVLNGTLELAHEYEQGMDAGEYTITPRGLTSDKYIISYKPGTLKVFEKQITEADVALGEALTYNGSEQEQKIVVTDGVTYEVTNNTRTDAGTYTLTVTGTGNYTGSVELEWTIAQKTLTTADIVLIGDDLTYNGKAQTKEVKGVTDDITFDVVTGNTETNAGTHIMTVTGTGNYTGSVELEWTIDKAPLTVKANDNVIYVGDEPAHAGVTCEGFVSAADEALFDANALTFEYTYSKGQSAGNYKIKPIYDLELKNYTINPVEGNLIVKEKITIKVEGETILQGTSFVPTGYKVMDGNGVEVEVDGLKVTLKVKTSDDGEIIDDTSVLAPGQYVIVAETNEIKGYEFNCESGKLTVEEVQADDIIATVKAVDKTVAYGQKPNFTYSPVISGLKVSYHVVKDGTIYTDLTKLDVGEYDIILEADDMDGYTITAEKGKLTVEQSKVVIKPIVSTNNVLLNADPNSIVITPSIKSSNGGATPAVEDLWKGYTIVDKTGNSVASLEDLVKVAGEYTIKPIVNPDFNSNYKIDVENATLVVSPKTLTVRPVVKIGENIVNTIVIGVDYNTDPEVFFDYDINWEPSEEEKTILAALAATYTIDDEQKDLSAVLNTAGKYKIRAYDVTGVPANWATELGTATLTVEKKTVTVTPKINKSTVLYNSNPEDLSITNSYTTNWTTTEQEKQVLNQVMAVMKYTITKNNETYDLDVAVKTIGQYTINAQANNEATEGWLYKYNTATLTVKPINATTSAKTTAKNAEYQLITVVKDDSGKEEFHVAVASDPVKVRESFSFSAVDENGKQVPDDVVEQITVGYTVTKVDAAAPAMFRMRSTNSLMEIGNSQLTSILKGDLGFGEFEIVPILDETKKPEQYAEIKAEATILVIKPLTLTIKTGCDEENLILLSGINAEAAAEYFYAIVKDEAGESFVNNIPEDLLKGIEIRDSKGNVVLDSTALEADTYYAIVAYNEKICEVSKPVNSVEFTVVDLKDVVITAEVKPETVKVGASEDSVTISVQAKHKDGVVQGLDLTNDSYTIWDGETQITDTVEDGVVTETALHKALNKAGTYTIKPVAPAGVNPENVIPATLKVTAAIDITITASKRYVVAGEEPELKYTITDADGNEITDAAVNVSLKVVDAEGKEVTNFAEYGKVYTIKVEYEESDKYNITKKDGELRVVKFVSAGTTLSLEGLVYMEYFFTPVGFDESIDFAKDGGVVVWTGDSKPENRHKMYIGAENCENIEGMYLSDLFNVDYWAVTSLGIKAKEYGDRVYMRAYVKVGEDQVVYGGMVNSSPEAYCEEKLVSTSTSNEIKQTCAALLEYGTKAQELFDYKLDALVNSGWDLSAYELEFNTNMLDALNTSDPNKNQTLDYARGDIKSLGATLSLDSAILIEWVYNINIENVKTAQLLVWTEKDYQNASTLEGTQSYTVPLRMGTLIGQTGYVGQSQHIPAKQIGDTLYFCVKVETEDGAIYKGGMGRYSPDAYIADKSVNSPDEEIRAVVKALAVYSEKARILFNY